MVNVSGFIRRKKEQFRNMRDKQRQMELANREAELKRLKEERIKAEERARLETARRTEIARIKAANREAPNRLMAFGQGLAKVMNKGREEVKSMQAKSKGIEFGGGRRDLEFGGGRGPSFGGSGNSPFGEAKKTSAVQKRPTVTIHVR